MIASTTNPHPGRRGRLSPLGFETFASSFGNRAAKSVEEADYPLWGLKPWSINRSTNVGNEVEEADYPLWGLKHNDQRHYDAKHQ